MVTGIEIDVRRHGMNVSWTKERVGIGENELEELDWGKTSNLCVAWKTDDKQ